MRALVLGCAVAAGCGGGLDIDGTPGTPVPARFDTLIPYARVTVGDLGEKLLVCDSGSPITVLDGSAFPGLADGKHELDLGALGLTFHDAPVASWDLPGDDLAAGLFGGNLLGLFAFTLDYKGERLWLSDPYDPARRPADVDTLAEVALPAEVRGGGRSLLPGCGGSCGTIKFPATRFMVKVTFEASSQPVWVVVDTGASGVVMDAALFASLPAAGRPRLDGAVVATVEGDQPAFLSRVWRARLEGVSSPDAQIAVDDVPVIVVPSSDLLANLSKEAGVDARALLGGHLLRAHLTTLDYAAHRLRLARYRDLSHIDPDEFVGVGLSFYRDGQDWRVLESYTNRDAYQRGIRVDDYLEEIDGMPVRGQPGEVVDAALAAFGLGKTVPITFRNLDGTHTVDVLVEDLLPHFGPPT